MAKQNATPKTINRRIPSLSSFKKFLSGAVNELRLPITVPNPAHAQFIAREASDPVDEIRALLEARARQLLSLVAEDSIIALRDRAILAFYVSPHASRLAARSASMISIRTATRHPCASV